MEGFFLDKVVTSCSYKMFAIAFDMDIKELRNTYGDPYNNASVRDIRAFKVENWSNFTDIVKED